MANRSADASIDLEGLQHHAGTIRSTQPLTIESIPAQWAYTISLPVRLEGHRPPVVVTARVSVDEGKVGAVIVRSDLTTILSRVPPAVGVGRHSLQIPLETFAADARVVFRNYTQGDSRCVFTLERLDLRDAEPDALATPSLLTTVTEGDPPRINLSKLQAALNSPTQVREWDDDAVFDLLRKKWGTVPGGLDDRRSSADLLALPDPELKDLWLTVHRESTTGAGAAVRGWYQERYRNRFKGLSVMDVGSGMGIDGLEFARHGAHMTFVDIVETNLRVLERLCRIFGIAEARFVHLRNLASLEALPNDFDVIWCQGSMINAPFDFAARESAALVKHLKVGGHWIELAYPRERWERDGRPAFSVWGTMTDGEGTPWMEWYDLERLLKRLAPATFTTEVAVNFHNDDFNWFDMVRVS